MLSMLIFYLRVAWTCKTPVVLILDKEYKPISVDTLNDISTRITENFEYIKEISD